ncbi:uncharacterized protein LOC131852221 [Achroia grisella]|uniref:uncharacterized protein LOC131852221 n=1 Tax=Achroia grisella TaxID=688607 RepID=UPI0027D27B62|nr:uncharacterized protein LOC131852221 [Achroia grisella]
MRPDTKSDKDIIVRRTVVSNEDAPARAAARSSLTPDRKQLSDLLRDGSEWKKEIRSEEWTKVQRKRYRNRFIGLKGKAEILPNCTFKAADETWLLPHELAVLGTVDNNFGYFGKSAVDMSQIIKGILRGRPFGGVALLWRKSIFTSVSVIPCLSDRIAAIKITVSERTMLFFSIYMPTNTPDNFVEFCNCLSEVAAIVESSGTENIYIMGDFNAHPGELFETELLNFCNEQQWSCADYVMLGRFSGTFSFISDVCGSKRWLDHCIVTEAALRTVCDVEIYEDVYWSDHFPLVVHINLGIVAMNTSVKYQDWQRDPAIWGTREVTQVDNYFRLCTESLSALNVPFDVSQCGDSLCCNEGHRQSIDIFYNNMISLIRKAAILSGNSEKSVWRRHAVPGWNKYVRDAHRQARQAFINWKFYGEPRCGPLYVTMREKGKTFKEKLKFCQNNAEQIKLDILGAEHKGKNFKRFWKLTQKLSPKPSIPVSVNSISNPKDIADLFMNHFKVDPVLQPSTRSECARSTKSRVPVQFSTDEIKYVIKSMTRGKSPGHDSLSVEHFQCAGPQLLRVLTALYNLCIQHSYLPNALMRTIVVPIAKNKTGDLSNKENYRPISLATIAAKVLDGVLERRVGKYFNIHDAQFGFQPGLSTETAIMALKDTVSSARIGCSIHGNMINSISYADDMVLLSPSISALRRLLKTCEEYAEFYIHMASDTMLKRARS